MYVPFRQESELPKVASTNAALKTVGVWTI